MPDRESHGWPAPRVSAIILLASLGVFVLFLPVVLWTATPPPRSATRPAPTTTSPSPPVARPHRRAADDERPRPTTTVAPPTPLPPIEPELPITEQRRVQSGPQHTPVEPARPSPNADDEWDRSPAARRRGVARFGGTPRTESAVDAGLRWLAAHQSPDGSWDRFEYARQCPDDDRCPGVAIRRTDASLEPGLTGLCLLAFLGAGQADADAPYAVNVARATDWLLRAQQVDGSFGHDASMAGYNTSIATLALAEHFALTRDARDRPALEAAVQHLVAAQQDLGGWDYLLTPGRGRNDMSITAWVVQALHACAAVDIAVPKETLVAAALHMVRMTEADGRVRYADSGRGFKLDENMRPVYRHGPAMAAAGLMTEQLLGWRIDSEIARRQTTMLLADPPSAARARGGDPKKLHSEYYWYYGTLAMFQRGEEDWQRWNARLRDAILPLQDRTIVGDRRRHTYGSWAPYGRDWGTWGRMGSRVYTTAICTLTLEIYYRHTPTFLTGALLTDSNAWRELLATGDAQTRRLAIDALGALRLEIGEPVLVEALRDNDAAVTLAAAVALAALDSPMGRARLEDVVLKLPPWERAPVEAALERIAAVEALPATRGHVRLYDAASRLATLDLPRSYVGMIVRVRPGDADEVRMQIVRRFTSRTTVIARLMGEDAAPPPVRGDTAVSATRN